MKERYYREEEDFHGQDRKQFRKERRHAQETDRSKFKKTDLGREKKEEPPPTDPNLRRGRVLAITGEGIWTDVDGVKILCILKGLIKKDKMQAKNLIAVGDFVKVLPTASDEGSIIYIEERVSTLSRLDHSGKNEQLIAVNIDQVFITSSLIQPPLKPALIDRYLIAAEKGNMHPIILINKIDQLPHATKLERLLYEETLLAYERLGLPVLSVSTTTGIGIESLRALMDRKASVFSGQSGVGKSSLLNAAFGFEQKIGDLAQKTFKGSHTTTTAQLLPLPGGGFCIDTPGIRSFGIWALTRENIRQHYREFIPFAKQCRYPNCTHLTEPSCAVQKAVEDETISCLRFESYRTLFEEGDGIDNRSKRKKEDL